MLQGGVSHPQGIEVSRPGAMPGPTVTVRMKEKREKAVGCAVGVSLV